MNTQPRFGAFFDNNRLQAIMTDCPSAPALTDAASGRAVPMTLSTLGNSVAGVLVAASGAEGVTFATPAWTGELQLAAGVDVVDLELEIEGQSQPLTVRRPGRSRQ